jgi:hypothetical protein
LTFHVSAALCFIFFIFVPQNSGYTSKFIIISQKLLFIRFVQNIRTIKTVRIQIGHYSA